LCFVAGTKKDNRVNRTTNTPLVIAFIVVVLLLVFGGGAITGGVMHGEMDESGWMGECSWVRNPALLTLGLGVVLSRVIFTKKS
jgi:chromate transport protein ChrA